MTIEAVYGVDSSGKVIAGPASAGLSGRLAFVLSDPAASFKAESVILVLDGKPMVGLRGPEYDSSTRTLIFQLVRNTENADAWKALLLKPTFEGRSVSVGLTLEMPQKGAEPKLIAWKSGKSQPFEFEQISSDAVIFGGSAILLVIVLVWGAASTTNILRDALLPQLPGKDQPFSLGRTQMAFWFTVVFSSYLFLYIVLSNYNTMTSQALMLMGISAGTAVFAVAIDAAKDTPIGRANDTLRAIGLNTYQDVLNLQGAIAAKNAAINAAASGANPALIADLVKLQAQEQTWKDTVAKYKSGGFFSDLTTDINGPALHRLQIVVWTVTLGVMFLLNVYGALVMPDFSPTLLALMGVTSAGYLGFKYPEKQN